MQKKKLQETEGPDLIWINNPKPRLQTPFLLPLYLLAAGSREDGPQSEPPWVWHTSSPTWDDHPPESPSAEWPAPRPHGSLAARHPARGQAGSSAHSTEMAQRRRQEHV